MSEEEKNVIEEIKKSIATQDRLNDEIRKSGVDLCVHSKRVDIYRVVLNLIEKQQKEIETYKKIAEILTANIYIPECKTCFKDKDCHKCIIDWAKSEVEKDDVS